MEGEELELKAKIFYYFRERYYNLMMNACKDGMSKFKSDSSFNFYYSLALMLNNRFEECINQLESLKFENDTQLASTIALMYAYRLHGTASKELFHQLDTQIREIRKSAAAVDFYYSGFTLYVLNKQEKALDYLDKSLNIQADLFESITLKGWILLNLKRSNQKVVQNTTDSFETVLSNNKRNLDANLGVSESYLCQNKIQETFDSINKAVVRFPSSSLPLIYKMKIQFSVQDWDQTIETMNRIINDRTNNLDALKMNIVILLCRDANYDEAVVCIKQFMAELELKEPKNGKILLDCAQLFSRICGRHQGVLSETFKMVERALQINSEDVEAIIELGYQSLMSNHMKEAQKYFKMATKVDESSFRALLGLSLCGLRDNGKSDQVKKQVDYLLELEEAQNSARLYLIRAQIADNSEEALVFLKKACDLQMSSVKYFAYSDNYLLLLDPDFSLDIIKEYLKYISSSDSRTSSRVSPTVVTTGQNVLKAITKACPGLSTSLYLLAKLQYFSGEATNAMNSLEQILPKVDSDTSSDAHLLMAQIQVKSGYYERAAQSLEMGLSHNFKVRENPLYHYIRGLVDKNTNNLQDAVKSLTTALSLVNTKPTAEDKNLTLSERASIYIELIEVHTLVGQGEEAAKLLEDAVEEFHGTPEEARILILSADHSVKRRNIQAAIDLLNKVKPKESYYLEAKTKLAEILLKYRMDRYAYLQCYQEMVDENPGPDSYILLGDAYMNILEPDDALECYNLALQQNPKDSYLTEKMGKALVETHYFARAVTFYKDAIKSTDNPELKLQLGDLYMQLKEYEKAQVLLMTELEGDGSQNEDLTYLQFKTRLLALLAQVQERAGNLNAALSTLKDARDNQNRVRKRFAVEHNDVPEEEIKTLVEIGVKLAEISTTLKNNEQAIQFYKDAIDISSNDINILAALAKQYMQMNSLDSCQQICANILRIDPENEIASVMMADIAFRKIDFDMALFHFTQLISKQPTNWTALVRLVEIMRRTGSLNDFQEYLNNAEISCDNPSKEPGFLFCTALYQWYSGNLNGALRNFNGARQDSEWGQQALYNMIEICLNPDDELLGDQFMESEDSEYRDSRSMALKTAERLLKEFRQRLEVGGSDLIKYKLLLNFKLLATQEKPNIERALEDFIAIASQNAYKDHVGPILGMSTAYTLLKQSQRAKNQLKRVAKIIWTFEDAEYLERCWLLLADYYIQSAKFDVASDLLNKVVQHNKSCSKAFEYLGFIAEKEQHYKEAANNYDYAWRYGGKTNAGIGYKLAYNLMKCKNFADAIEIGHQVLKLNPGYPKIKKDILDKSMSNLRV